MSTSLYFRPVDSILRNRKGVTGGLCNVKFAPIESVLSWPPVDPAEYVLKHQVLLSGAGKWFTANMPRGGMNNVQRNGDSGPYMETTVEVSIPFAGAENHLLLDVLKYHRIVLQVTDHTGVIYLVGHTTGATFSFAETTGNNRKEQPMATGTFTWINEDSPLIYEGSNAFPGPVENPDPKDEDQDDPRIPS